MKKSLLTMFVSLFSIILAVAAPVDEHPPRPGTGRPRPAGPVKALHGFLTLW